MDDVEGNTLIGAINGTLMNGAALVEDDAIRGRALKLDDNYMQYVDYGLRQDGCLGDLLQCYNGYTWMAWVKLDQALEDRVTIYSTGGETYLSYGVTVFYRYSNTLLTVCFRTTQTSNNFKKVSSSLEEQKWNHIAFTYYNFIAYLYINGCLADVNEDLVADTKDYDTLDFVYIGQSVSPNYGYYLHGWIDEMYIFTDQMTDEFISQSYLNYFVQA